MKKRPINWESSKFKVLIEAYKCLEGPRMEYKIVEAVRKIKHNESITS